MLKNIIRDETLNQVWNNDYFEICKQRLSPNAYETIIKEINNIIDERLQTNSKLVVIDILPVTKYTNTIWEETYTQACAHDECYAGLFVGLLVCQELIAREETWYFVKQTLSSHMVYFTKDM